MGNGNAAPALNPHGSRLRISPAPHLRPSALYIHIPFCVRKCPYCDFYSVAGREHLMDAYVRALKAELSHARREIGPLSLRSLYLGGGTPTVLPTATLADILAACAGLFALAQDVEVTCECNPGRADAQALRELQAAGVNRLSLGVQSLRDEELRFLERVHSAAEGREAVLQARAAGFERLSLDLIYCLPRQTPAAWEATLREAVALAPDHLSAYCLQIEPGTPLARRVEAGTVKPLSDDKQADLYLLTTELLQDAGYAHYEVSNYAQPGAECRHNLTYWHNQPYLGVGAGAWSFVGGERRQNAPDVEAYVGAWHAGQPPVVFRERCTGTQAANETLMMGLRLREGIDLSAFRERHGLDLATAREAILARLSAEGLAHIRGPRLALTTAGLAVAAEITALLAFSEEE